MKSDPIQEIINKKSRNLKRINRFAQYSRKHTLIMSTALYLNKNTKIEKDVRKELLKYIPIGLTNCIENYFRMLVKDLLNKGNPFLNNFSNFEHIDVKFKSVVSALAESLSISDLISHLIRLNSLENINKVMSKLLKKNFLSELKSIEILKDDPKVISNKKFIEFAIKNIKKTYELRNIFCHEIALNYKFDTNKILEYVVAVQSFILFTELYVQKVLEKR